MSSSTFPIRFSCEGEHLQAMLHAPAAPGDTGVLVVVGGPQYKVGSHRQFVLLGRALAERGIPVLRFDYRGLGDSTGAQRTFEDIGSDVRAAIDEFFRRVPGLERVIVWGLCDAASAAMFYGAGDGRVCGLVLLNPWARSEQSVAQAYLRHYYLRRLLSAEAWRSVFSGRKSPAGVVRSIWGTLRAALGPKPPAAGPATTLATQGTGTDASQRPPLTERMRRGLEEFKGPVLFIMSGDDITAAEFRSVAHSSRSWRRLVSAPRVTTCELAGADHTFSTRAWRDQVAQWTAAWIEQQWPRPAAANTPPAAERVRA